MSHPEQLAYFQAVVDRNPALVSGARVLEIGSFDVNGSMRERFETAATYAGVDLVDGPGVDRVAFGHEVDDPDGSYDVTVSGECLEHDPHWRRTFANMIRMTRPGGIVAFSCASHGRPEHGTRRSDVTDSPGTQAEALDYYRNLVAADFDPRQLDDAFSTWRFWTMPTTFDLYFMGVRAGAESEARLPHEDDIERIRRLLPLPHRAIRLPLRVVARLVQDEDRYQRLVMPYWLFLLRRSAGRQRAERTV
jgi:SAM-dependent methyltransferase